MENQWNKLAARDRVRRREAAKLTPEQRMEHMAALLRHYSDVLSRSPEAMDRFLRRNLRKRAVRRDATGPS